MTGPTDNNPQPDKTHIGGDVIGGDKVGGDIVITIVARLVAIYDWRPYR